MKKINKSSKPSSLFHYTRLDSLQFILPSKKEDFINGIPYMDFRFSYPRQCNDPMEVRFFTDALYTESDISNQLKKDVDDVKSDIGLPFIFCLIHHRRAEMSKCPLTEIPMWNMYGDNNQGVRMRLDYNLLKKYCNEQRIDFFPCQYLNKESMRQTTQAIREKMKGLKDYALRTEECQSIYKNYVQYKTINWSYEYEYRMAVWSNNYESSNNCLYYHVKIPLSCLKAIQIGSSANYNESFKIIEDIKERIQKAAFKADFAIERSKLLIRYKDEKA